jgi:hypothetical protein
MSNQVLSAKRVHHKLDPKWQSICGIGMCNCVYNGRNIMAEFFFVTQKPNSGLGRLVFEVSILHIIRHTHTHARTVGLLWTSDQLVAEAATRTTNTTDERPWPQRRIRAGDTSNGAAADLCLRMHSHRDRQCEKYLSTVCIWFLRAIRFGGSHK